MKMVRMLVAAAMLLVPAAAAAQTVEGVVLDDSTGAPVANVRVELVHTGGGAPASSRTDSTGAFRFDPRPPGTVILRVRHPSYTPIDSLSVAVAKDERVEIELRLGHSPILLEPIIVRARADEGVAGFRDRMARGGFGRFLGRKDLERRGTSRASDLLRMIPGVRIEQGAPGSALVVMRGGSGQCLPDIYIDGMRMRQLRESSVDAFVNVPSLEGVEVYTSSAQVPNVFVSSFNSCGVVAFWTKPAPTGKWSWRKMAIGVGVFLLLAVVSSR
ncbi:MAG TPA: carboxypeptidase regulatory-like domain-containing protein [Longimicrobium sp.]